MNKLKYRGKTMIKLRSLNDDHGVVHLPRLLAITIPFLFVIGLHIANVFTEVPDVLMEPVIQITILFSGAVIAVLGLQFGLFPVIALLAVTIGIGLYYYIQFIANLI